LVKRGITLIDTPLSKMPKLWKNGKNEGVQACLGPSAVRPDGKVIIPDGKWVWDIFLGLRCPYCKEIVGEPEKKSKSRPKFFVF
jgi:hypothetical protein